MGTVAMRITFGLSPIRNESWLGFADQRPFVSSVRISRKVRAKDGAPGFRTRRRTYGLLDSTPCDN